MDIQNKCNQKNVVYPTKDIFLQEEFLIGQTEERNTEDGYDVYLGGDNNNISIHYFKRLSCQLSKSNRSPG